MYYMLQYPEVQIKVQEELDRVVGSGRRISLRDKENLPYTGKLKLQAVRNVNKFD